MAITLIASPVSTTIREPSVRSRKANVALWTAQGLTAAIFLIAGGSKLAMSMEMLAAASPLPALLLKFVGVCEVVGALGLVLPGIFRIRQSLTPLAAALLAPIVLVATIVTVATMGVAMAVLPFVTLLLSLTIAFGRTRS